MVILIILTALMMIGMMITRYLFRVFKDKILRFIHCTTLCDNQTETILAANRENSQLKFLDIAQL